MMPTQQRTTGLGNCEPLKRPPEVGNLIDRLTTELDLLDKTIREVEQKLNPILRNTPEVPTPTQADTKINFEVLTPLGTMLQSQIGRCCSMVKELNRIIDLIEV